MTHSNFAGGNTGTRPNDSRGVVGWVGGWVSVGSLCVRVKKTVPGIKEGNEVYVTRLLPVTAASPKWRWTQRLNGMNTWNEHLNKQFPLSLSQELYFWKVFLPICNQTGRTTVLLCVTVEKTTDKNFSSGPDARCSGYDAHIKHMGIVSRRYVLVYGSKCEPKARETNLFTCHRGTLIR